MEPLLLQLSSVGFCRPVVSSEAGAECGSEGAAGLGSVASLP